VAGALALAGCGGQSPSPSVASGLTVTSTAFANGASIPVAYTCAGDGRRPPITWSGDLHGAVSLALVVDDPDAPSGNFYHWVVTDIPAATTGISKSVPAGAHELENSAGKTGWTPPCPPSGTHHYRFTVYGLSAAAGNVSRKDALAAIEKNAVVQGRLTGLYTHAN
jgi:Raf kinase inhibitor-like YbhB/YbcL family protein